MVATAQCIVNFSRITIFPSDCAAFSAFSLPEPKEANMRSGEGSILSARTRERVVRAANAIFGVGEGEGSGQRVNHCCDWTTIK